MWEDLWSAVTRSQGELPSCVWRAANSLQICDKTPIIVHKKNTALHYGLHWCPPPYTQLLFKKSFMSDFGMYACKAIRSLQGAPSVTLVPMCALIFGSCQPVCLAFASDNRASYLEKILDAKKLSCAGLFLQKMNFSLVGVTAAIF